MTDVNSLSCDQFVAELLDPGADLKRQIRHVRCAGLLLPVRIMDIPKGGAGVGAPLIFAFHGVSPKDFPYPFFYGQGFAAAKGALPRTVLAICDATLEQFPELRFGWYEGSKGRDVPAAVHELIAAVVAGTAPSRTILTGGSTGAHAALRHVGDFPGALFFALNPLPRLNGYWRDGVAQYFQACWDGEYDPEALTSPHVINDPTERYAGTALQNDFFVVQNPTDPHFLRQGAAMLEMLGRNYDTLGRVMAVVPPMGDSVGHGAPKGLYEQWMEAVIHAPDTRPLSILQTYQAMEQAREPARAARSGAAALSPQHLAQAREIVKMLPPRRAAE